MTVETLVDRLRNRAFAEATHMDAVSGKSAKLLKEAADEIERLLDAIGDIEHEADIYNRTKRENDRLSNMVTDYSSKLGEWQELTGCSCPSAAKREIDRLKQNQRPESAQAVADRLGLKPIKEHDPLEGLIGG